jgi:hypothetical protein
MKKIILLFISIPFLISSCGNSRHIVVASLVDENKPAEWKTNNYIDSVQILLTNEYQLNDSYGFGASSFLVKAGEDTLLCTAKHLLGSAMGISPEVKTNNFESSLKYWKAFPRQGLLSVDTIITTSLENKKVNEPDIILQKCRLGKSNNIVALTPRFSKARSGEKFEIIGCEYSDEFCHQRKYIATMDSYQNGSLLLKSDSIFTPSGFSGAPVIDANGFVIGLLSGGSDHEGKLYLWIEVLSKVKDYLD